MTGTGRRRGTQAGFTMTEVMIAAVVATITLMAVAMALTTGITSNRTIKGNEQATALANQQIEDARNRPFAELTLKRNDAAFGAAGTGLTLSGTEWSWVPSAGAPAEKLEAYASGGVYDFDRTVNDAVLGLNYKVRTYITLANNETGTTNLGSDGLNRARRITVIVSWQRDGATFTSKSSTIVTRSRRGLPEPKFEVTPVTQTVPTARGTATVPGELVLTHTIRNLGITDAYDVVATLPGGWTSANPLRLYADTNGSGLFEIADDLPLTDTNGNTKLDTGTIATDTQVTIFIVRTMALTDPLGNAVVNATVFSGAHDSVTQPVTDTVIVGVKFDRFYPYNQTLFSETPTASNHVGGASNLLGNSTHKWPMEMDPRSPFESGTWGSVGAVPWTTLEDYSQELTAKTVPGRLIYPRSTAPSFNTAITGTGTPGLYQAVWEKRLSGLPTPSGGQFGQQWHTQLYIANTDKSHCDDPIRLRLFLNKAVGTGSTSATATITNIAQTTVTLPMAGSTRAGGDGCAFRGYSINVTGLAFTTLNNNNWLQFRIALDETTTDRDTPIAVSYGIANDDRAPLDLHGPTFTEIGRP